MKISENRSKLGEAKSFNEFAKEKRSIQEESAARQHQEREDEFLRSKLRDDLRRIDKEAEYFRKLNGSSHDLAKDDSSRVVLDGKKFLNPLLDCAVKIVRTILPIWVKWEDPVNAVSGVAHIDSSGQTVTKLDSKRWKGRKNSVRICSTSDGPLVDFSLVEKSGQYFIESTGTGSLDGEIEYNYEIPSFYSTGRGSTIPARQWSGSVRLDG